MIGIEDPLPGLIGMQTDDSGSSSGTPLIGARLLPIMNIPLFKAALQQFQNSNAANLQNTATATSSFFESMSNPLADGSGQASAGFMAAAANWAGGSENTTDPLILGFSPTNINLSVLTRTSPYFDWLGSGFAHQTGWIGTGTGFLVQMNSSGQIQPFVGTANGGNGFAELAQLDINGTGVIDASDPTWSSLYVWQDTNGNGRVDSGELESLSSLGIVAINLAYAPADQIINGNTVVGIGSVTMADGTTRELADVNLQTSSVYTKPDQTPVIPTAIAALPELHGYGQMMDLQSQMAIDPTLVGLVQDFEQLVADGSSMASLLSATDSILFEWAGDANIDPASRGGIIDARRLEFLENYLGQPLTFPNGNYGNPSDPGFLPSVLTNNAFIDVENGSLARLLVQTSPTLAAEFTVDQTLDAVSPTTDLATSLADLSADFGTITAQTLDSWQEAGVVLNAYQSDYSIDPGMFSQALGLLGVPGLDVVENAVSQGLSVAIDQNGTLDVSNAASDGILIGGYGRPSGLSFVYTPTDGNVDIEFAEPSWILGFQGQVLNTLTINASAEEFAVALNPNGDEVLTDDFTGGTLAISGEALTGDGIEHGVGTIQFLGAVWTGLHEAAAEGQSDLSSSYAGVCYDTRGIATTVEATGDGNTFDFGAGYGQVTVTPGGFSNTIQLGGLTSADDVSLRTDGTTGDLIVELDTGDTLTVAGDYVGNGTPNHIGTITFADGTSWDMANTFVLGLGEGNVSYDVSGETYNLRVGADIDPSQIFLQSDDAGDLTVGVLGDPADSITFQNDLVGYMGGNSSRVQNIEFADGTTLDLAAANTFTWIGTATDTTLVGSGWGANVFDMGPGGDTVYAGYGSHGGSNQNTFDFRVGDGNATIYTNSSPGTLDLGPGLSASDVVVQVDNNGDMTVAFTNDPDDSITLVGDLWWYWGMSGSRVGEIVASDGTISLSGSPTSTWIGTVTDTALVGSRLGDNVFEFGSGGDTAYAGSYNSNDATANIFDFGQGDGQATVYMDGNQGTLRLGAGISASDVLVQADNSGDLIVALADDPEDSITFDGDFHQGGGLQSYLKTIQCADGSVIDVSSPLTFNWQQTSAGQALVGSNDGSNIFLLGPGGSTVTTNGDVPDQNYADQINYARGDGAVTVNVVNSYVSSLNLTAFAESDVMLQADGSNDLIVAFKDDPSDSLVFENVLYSDPWGVLDQLRGITFSDGTFLPTGIPYWGQGGALTFTWQGTATNTVLIGSNYGANVFDLGPGGDTVTTNGDVQHANYADVINYARGDGAATVNVVNSFVASLNLTGFSESDVLLQSDASNDLVVAFRNDPGDSLVFKNVLYSDSWGVLDQLRGITFSDGTFLPTGIPYWGEGGPLSFTWIGDATHTTLVGGGWGANVFDLGAGGDTVVCGNGSKGGSAQNTVVFSSGDGAAMVNPNGGAVTVEFQSGISLADIAYSTDQAGDLIASVVGTSDSVTIQGVLNSGSNVQMSFLNGATLTKAQLAFAASETSQGATVIGNGGNDVLDGQGTATTLVGNGGNDTYVFRDGENPLTIVNESASNSGAAGQLDFGSGLSESNLWLAQSGNDLVGTFLGTADQFTVKDWFSGNPTAQLASLVASDGAVLSGASVAGLVTAMSDYATQNPWFSAGGASSMPTTSYVQSAIAAAWNH